MDACAMVGRRRAWEGRPMHALPVAAAFLLAPADVDEVYRRIARVPE